MKTDTIEHVKIHKERIAKIKKEIKDRKLSGRLKEEIRQKRKKRKHGE